MELTKAREMRAPAETERDAPRRICFVCTGNTCRSPMAEAVANALIKETGRTDLRAFSAGLFANDGEPIAPNAVLALEEAGVAAVKGRDYHRHVAHTLRAEEAEGFDLLVGMTDAHAMQMMMSFPEVAERITVMPIRIPDPWGGDASVYRASLSEITEAVRRLLFSEEKA